MKKIYLLHRNQRVTKSKNTLSMMRRDGTLNSVDKVMIPIYDIKTAYMAVDGDYLEMMSFGHAEIKYHLALRAIGGHGGDSFYDEEIYSYCPVKIDATSIEALYNCLHNVFAYHYVRGLISDDSHLDRTFYLLVDEIEVTIYDGKRVCDSFHGKLDNPDDIPFDIDDLSISMLYNLAEHFGISGFRHSVKHSFGKNITIRDRDDGKIWREETGNFELYSDISHVFIASPFSWSYILVKDIEYDQILRMNNGTLYIMPINLMTYDISTERPNIKMLTPTTYLDIPKYAISKDLYDAAIYSEDLAMQFDDACVEIYPYLVMDGEDAAVAIEYLPIILKTYHEMIKVWVAEDKNTDNLMPFRFVTTVTADFSIDLDHMTQSPSDDSFHIYTDVYQDEMPNIKEVCYLLAKQEKSK